VPNLVLTANVVNTSKVASRKKVAPFLTHPVHLSTCNVVAVCSGSDYRPGVAHWVNGTALS